MDTFGGMTVDTTIEADGDRIRGKGFDPLESGVYDLRIKYAYATKSKGGALSVNVVLETPDGREIKDQQWVTSGDAKGNNNFYLRDVKDKEGNVTGQTRHYLPGFNVINSLCALTLGKGLDQVKTEEKSIKLYNFDAKAEVLTTVAMATELIGQEVKAGVLHQIVDKNSKNDATGEYEPTGKVRNTNVVDKYFRAGDNKTVDETRNPGSKAEFIDAWKSRWENQVDDQSTTVKTAGVAGAPATGVAAPKSTMFA